MKVERNIGRDVRVTQRSGRSTFSTVELPGLALVDPEADPSQASHQVLYCNQLHACIAVGM